MKFRKFGRMACIIAVAGTMVVAPAVLSGCSGYAEARITISYKEVDYVLDYTLYRNMYPQTVTHFIELAGAGFYDDTIIHNYQSSYWYGGGYDYDGESYTAAFEGDTEDLLDYMEGNCKEREYAELAAYDNYIPGTTTPVVTPTVYRDLIDGRYTRPLNTLIGEFSNNQHKIDNGALKSAFGNLRMFYTAKSGESVDNKRVYLDKQGSDIGVQGDYVKNSATSLFSIQVSTSTSTDSSYCIFGKCSNTQVLTDLKTEVAKSYTTKDVKLYVDNLDEYLGANVNEATYRLTKTPIIIKSVVITKY